MRLEESVSSVELDEDAADTPYIAGETPAEIEDDFGGAVMSSTDHRTMVFSVERRGSEVYQADVRVEEDFTVFGVPLGESR